MVLPTSPATAAVSQGLADAGTPSAQQQPTPTPIEVLTVPIDPLDPAAPTLPADADASFDPNIRLILDPQHLEPDLCRPLQELCQHTVRGVMLYGPPELPLSVSAKNRLWLWHIRITLDPSLAPRQVTTTSSHRDFTKLADSYIPASSLPSDVFTVQIRYRRKCEAFRALGHILAMTRHRSTPASFSAHDSTTSSPDPSSQVRFEWNGNASLLNISEQCLFETLGVMIDCSRNGVLLVESVFELLRFFALTGINMLQLYTEDTYEIPDEPFFGYFRGPYKAAELKEIDNYATLFGIEVIPCIQTLGHLGQMLQWPRYGALRDTSEVLLAGSDAVYAFIEKMLTAVTQPLRSKRIHIGMDEAHGVGEGRFRQIFGFQDGTTVFTNHLRRVNDICKRLGLSAMIWSDMLFCLASKNNSLGGYYDSANPATPALIKAIPEDVDLVYWDYYHTLPESYANKIQQHWDLINKPPWMASGIWTWSRHWTALPFTFETVRASMKASKSTRLGVKNALTTIWGDEGNECDIWSAFPGLLYYAEHAYTAQDEVDVTLLKRKFDGITGGCFDDFVYASKLDDLQPEAQPLDFKSHFTPNMSKFLLWEDPFYSILSPQYAGRDMEIHYSQLAAYLEFATSNEPSSLNPLMPPQSVSDVPLNSRLLLPKLLAKILALKCHLRDRLVYSYRNRDWEELNALAGSSSDSRMSRLRNLVDELWKYHRSLWMSTYKPFGWEILELRYGGLRARLETMHWRLISYLDVNDQKVTRLEELEVQNETAYPGNGLTLMLDYQRVSRPTYC